MDEDFVEQVLCYSFSEHRDYLAVGTQKGYRVFQLADMKRISKKELGFGIGNIALIMNLGVIAFSGHKANSEESNYLSTDLLLWNDQTNQLGGHVRYLEPILGMRVVGDRIIKSFKNCIRVFSLLSNAEELVFGTNLNPLGLFSVSLFREENIIAFPEKKIGKIKISKLVQKSRLRTLVKSTDETPRESKHDQTNSEIMDTLDFVMIQAHHHQLQIIRLSESGGLLMTASTEGKVIRIFDVQLSMDTGEGYCIKELKRGLDPALIYNISVNNSEEMILCSSDSGTIHIFNMEEKIENLSRTSRGRKNSIKPYRVDVSKTTLFQAQSSITKINIGQYIWAEFNQQGNAVFGLQIKGEHLYQSNLFDKNDKLITGSITKPVIFNILEIKAEIEQRESDNVRKGPRSLLTEDMQDQDDNESEQEKKEKCMNSQIEIEGISKGPRSLLAEDKQDQDHNESEQEKDEKCMNSQIGIEGIQQQQQQIISNNNKQGTLLEALKERWSSFKTEELADKLEERNDSNFE